MSAQLRGCPARRPCPVSGSETASSWSDRSGAGDTARSGARDAARADAAVAIKLLHPELQSSAEAVERLEREAAILARLDHPHVARALGSGRDEGRSWLAMELVEGRSLADELAERAELARPLPIARVRSRIAALASALEAAHALGVVHRDLGPRNVMLAGPETAERLVLLDFGIARRLDGDPWAATTVGRRLGVPHLVAPEQLRGEPVGPASDVFALGGLVYGLVTLHHPWVLGPDAAPLGAHLDPGEGGPRALQAALSRTRRNLPRRRSPPPTSRRRSPRKSRSDRVPSANFRGNPASTDLPAEISAEQVAPTDLRAEHSAEQLAPTDLRAEISAKIPPPDLEAGRAAGEAPAPVGRAPERPV
jgi:serine/threonine protein kinase